MILMNKIIIKYLKLKINKNNILKKYKTKFIKLVKAVDNQNDVKVNMKLEN